MDPMKTVKERRDEILALAVKYGAHHVRVFGSVVRGQADEESDLDLLVTMEPGRSLLNLGGLLMEARDLLDCKVDVVTEQGLRPRIREQVLREAMPI